MSRSRIGWAGLLVLVFLVFLPSPDSTSAATGPVGMPPHPRLLEKIKRGQARLPRFVIGGSPTRKPGPGALLAPRQAQASTVRALAILVDFSDNPHTVSASFFDTLLFEMPKAGLGSVRDYFSEVSYGQLDVVTVNLPSSLGWIQAEQEYDQYVYGAYCTDGPYPHNCQKLAEDVVDAIDSVVDFRNYDNNGDNYAEPIILIHAGPGAEYTENPGDVWSHSWYLHYPRECDGVMVRDYVIVPEYWSSVTAISSDMTIGVFAHEMGHGFWSLPDLYDRYYTSYGIGDWSLMGSGSWNGPGFMGSSPAWPDAWSRAQMGLVVPAEVTESVSDRAIPQAYNNPGVDTILKLRSSSLASQEYFLIENRQKVVGSYDEWLPGSGLFIWHVDEAMNTYALQNDYECWLDPDCLCSDSQHYLVALEQADGLHHLEHFWNRGDAGDPFPGASDNRSWGVHTHPGSSSWYACDCIGVGVENISASGPTMTADLYIPGEPPTGCRFYFPLVCK